MGERPARGVLVQGREVTRERIFETSLDSYRICLVADLAYSVECQFPGDETVSALQVGLNVLT